MDDILWNMERQELTALVVIDLSAAFDTVDHDILLDVLNNRFGLDKNTLGWINSYLRPRKFKVNIGQSYSEEFDVKFSVPQGSIFGPVLYSTYASTLEETVDNVNRNTGDADLVGTNGEKKQTIKKMLTLTCMALQMTMQWRSHLEKIMTTVMSWKPSEISKYVYQEVKVWMD